MFLFTGITEIEPKQLERYKGAGVMFETKDKKNINRPVCAVC